MSSNVWFFSILALAMIFAGYITNWFGFGKSVPETKTITAKMAVVIALVVWLYVVTGFVLYACRYRYELVGVRLIRVDRLTSQGCFFVEGRWDSRPLGPPSPTSTPTDEKTDLSSFVLDSRNLNLCELH